MKIYTKIVWNIETGTVLEEESFDYSGPLAMCDRAQSKAVANQGMAQSAQNQQQGTQAFQGGIDTAAAYQKSVENFRRNNPYKVGGEFSQSQRTINADTSNAGTNSLADAMRLNAVRTGENAASYAPALAEAQRSASRDQAASEAKAEQTRIGNEADYNAKATQFASLTPDMYSRLYGAATGGASSNLNPAASAAKTPGFWDVMGPALVGGGASVGAGFTPNGGR